MSRSILSYPSLNNKTLKALALLLFVMQNKMLEQKERRTEWEGKRGKRLIIQKEGDEVGRRGYVCLSDREKRERRKKELKRGREVVWSLHQQ